MIQLSNEDANARFRGESDGAAGAHLDVASDLRRPLQMPQAGLQVHLAVVAVQGVQLETGHGQAWQRAVDHPEVNRVVALRSGGSLQLQGAHRRVDGLQRTCESQRAVGNTDVAAHSGFLKRLVRPDEQQASGARDLQSVRRRLRCGVCVGVIDRHGLVESAADFHVLVCGNGRLPKDLGVRLDAGVVQGVVVDGQRHGVLVKRRGHVCVGVLEGAPRARLAAAWVHRVHAAVGREEHQERRSGRRKACGPRGEDLKVRWRGSQAASAKALQHSRHAAGVVVAPQFRAVDAVVGLEEELAVEEREMRRTGSTRARMDVRDEASARLGAVREPKLPAVHAVVGAEEDLCSRGARHEIPRLRADTRRDAQVCDEFHLVVLVEAPELPAEGRQGGSEEEVVQRWGQGRRRGGSRSPAKVRHEFRAGRTAVDEHLFAHHWVGSSKVQGAPKRCQAGRPGRQPLLLGHVRDAHGAGGGAVGAPELGAVDAVGPIHAVGHTDDACEIRRGIGVVQRKRSFGPPGVLVGAGLHGVAEAELHPADAIEVVAAPAAAVKVQGALRHAGVGAEHEDVLDFPLRRPVRPFRAVVRSPPIPSVARGDGVVDMRTQPAAPQAAALVAAVRSLEVYSSRVNDQLGRSRAGRAWQDVLHQDGAAAGAIGAPQLASVCVVLGGEVQEVIEDEEITGKTSLGADFDVAVVRAIAPLSRVLRWAHDLGAPQPRHRLCHVPGAPR
eukprot:scaffold825_cov249-Pinguiococcus_pyrenoidosus.AAC.29